jgi:hypothetical protein
VKAGAMPYVDPRVSQLMSDPIRVIPIVGAGISAGSGWPDGKAIAKHLRAHFGLKEAVGQDPRKVASAIVEARLATEDGLQRELADFLQRNRPNQPPSDALKAISGAASGWVLTLNYDDSVEEAGRAAKRDVTPYTWRNLPDPQDTRPDAQHGLYVLHLHGAMSDAGSIILTDDQYETVESRESLRLLLAPLLRDHSACIFGSRMDEIWLYQLFTRLRERNPHATCC